MNAKYRNLPLLIRAAFLFAGLPAFAQFSMVLVGQTTNHPGSGYAQGIAVAGNYAYVAHDGYVEQKGLWIYDVSIPSNPVKVGSTNGGVTGGYPTRVVLSGSRAYLDESGMKIYDVANPTNPIYLGKSTNANVGVHAVSGNHAFLLGDYSGFRIYDVANPTTPFSVSSINLGPNARGIAVSGDHAYVVGEWYTNDQRTILQSFNVSDPTNPTLASQVSVPTSTNLSWSSIALSGNYAYLGGGMSLWIYDISNRTNLLAVGHVKTQVLEPRIAVLGNLAFLASGHVEIYDFADPTKPYFVGRSPYNLNARDIAVAGNHVFVARGYTGLDIFLLVPQLVLSLTNSNNLCVSWSVPPVNDFVLQKCSALGTGSWTDVTNVPVMVSNRNEMVVLATSDSMYFRLRSR